MYNENTSENISCIYALSFAWVSEELRKVDVKGISDEFDS